MKHVGVLMLALLILPWMGGVGEANVIPVPSFRGQIHEALSYAVADSDTVQVYNNDQGQNDPYEPFTMKTGVPVLRAEGEEPRISAYGGTHAVAYPADADTLTILDGFTILGGDTTVVMRERGILRNCTIDDDGDGTLIGVYHYRYGGRIENVEVTLDVPGVDARGILLHDSEATVKNCDVRILHSTDQGAAIKSERQYFTLEATIDSCFLSAPYGFGVDTENGTILSCMAADGSGVTRVALAFDLSGMREGEGRRVLEAVLSWQLSGIPTDETSEVVAYPATSAWTLAGEAPGVSENPAGSWEITPESYDRLGGLMRIDLRGLVSGWASGRIANHGVILATPDMSEETLSSQLANVRLEIRYSFLP